MLMLQVQLLLYRSEASVRQEQLAGLKQAMVQLEMQVGGQGPGAGHGAAGDAGGGSGARGRPWCSWRCRWGGRGQGQAMVRLEMQVGGFRGRAGAWSEMLVPGPG